MFPSHDQLAQENYQPYQDQGQYQQNQQQVQEEIKPTDQALSWHEKNKWYGDGENEEKQWVLIGRYAGARFKLDEGEEVRIINDDEVIATILDPDDIVSSYR